jgi:hypothetical protein
MAVIAAFAICLSGAGFLPVTPAEGTVEAASPAVTHLPGALAAVTALSAANLWAVGSTVSASGAQQTLIMHWNGKSWSRIAAPGCPEKPKCALAGLTGVEGTGPDDIWAVGYMAAINFSPPLRPLILHWNGKSWSVVSVSGISEYWTRLDGITVVSRRDAWAVGVSGPSDGGHNLIVHWNGKSWSRFSAVPAPGTSSGLAGIDKVSASDIWAVGSSASGTSGSTAEILHWNGKRWANSPSPKPASSSLNAVVAISVRNVLAIGMQTPGTWTRSLMMRWLGQRWFESKAYDCPLNCDTGLLSVAASAANWVWAAGSFANEGQPSSALIERWNGFDWSAPVFRLADASLEGVATVSDSDAWAVGESRSSAVLIVHWNGKRWAES